MTWLKSMVSTFEIRFSDSGRKSLKKLSSQDIQIILKKLAGLRKFSPEMINVKRLRGTAGGLFRLRVGDKRVIFEVEKGRKLIWILFVGYRNNVYRNLR